ncbi:CHC2 zinc finger domain-containing protein [Permianibacter aggregans]|uniref:DNA primase catalytic core n=1 Tax=Permianibacter aggregans TaxID=1510150 RepID=A0A4V6PWS7_9GAMM|nr:CHC2 zinc finger domain-containing protein [Permianibacter aggregans]QGX39333.1 toprim domain-containing protein [Permianibacter aggregans]QGX39341.1 toprim domain-containing protein [Permianibacter aggregans]TDQ49927.1 DNA primase catalytic core [Permianibacter aggregans]
MARIADGEIERLKAEVSLVRLVEAKGIVLKPHGKDRIGRCPFHDDKTPSLVVSPDKNLWHCLGACQAGGSVIDWVMKCEGVSFKHAVELLRGDVAVSRAPIERVVQKSTTPKLPSFLAADSDEQSLLRQVIDYYHECLQQSPEALVYLSKRGLESKELIETFKLGYANRTLGYRLPQKNRVEGAQLRGKLQHIGIYRESGHEHFTGSLVVPVINESGVITDVYGRKIGERLREGTPLHLYLPGPHQGVWNEAGLIGGDEVILCEALIDAMTFWVNGFKNVTASYGIEGFTANHLKAFKAHNIKRVLIAYDRDEAGDKAAQQLALKLTQEGFDCYRVNFPKGMDANEYALKVGPAAKSLGVVLRNAEWLGKGAAPTRNPNPVTPTEAEKAGDKSEAIAITPPLVASVAVAEPALSATPAPELKAPELDAHVKDGDVHITFGERRYRVRGHDKNTTPEQLKINLATSQGDAYHVDTLDLYSAKARAAFIKLASLELGLSEDIIKADIGHLLRYLEGLRDEQLKALSAEAMDEASAVNEALRSQALALLQSPDLLQQVLDDFDRCGVVGEQTNKLMGYLACVSRKLDKPLALMIQSSSAAGKSSLMEAVLQLMPEDERVQYSAMTGQALFYMGETNLKHKILAIAEEEGASRAAYALKLLQSDGSLTMASTGKDPVTGNLITQEYRVEGPVMMFLTTTAIDIDEELLNRCVVLSVNESREQTRAIHAQQRARRTLAGLTAKVERQTIIETHRQAQRLLRPLAVINPYAEQLTFLDSKTRTRRDHEKYLSLIDSIALLHQYQRPIKTLMHGEVCVEYIEVTLDDIATANRLAHEVLGRTLDELPPQTRKLLQLVGDMVRERCAMERIKQADFRFSRKDVRDACGWTDFQVKKHMQRLEDMEYVLVHRGMRGQSFVYELLWDGGTQTDQSFLPGLIDVDALRYDNKKEPLDLKLEPRKSPQVAAKEPRGSTAENVTIIEKNPRQKDLAEIDAENTLLPENITAESYLHIPSFVRSIAN